MTLFNDRLETADQVANGPLRDFREAWRLYLRVPDKAPHPGGENPFDQAPIDEEKEAQFHPASDEPVDTKADETVSSKDTEPEKTDIPVVEAPAIVVEAQDDVEQTPEVTPEAAPKNIEPIAKPVKPEPAVEPVQPADAQ